MTREQAAFSRIDHRPWPLPRGPWVGLQTWADLLFAHWALPKQALAPFIPAPLTLDTFQDHAYISVTPFRLQGFAVRPFPPPGAVASFLELNVRTYVTCGGKPGIWFFSLDANSVLAVLGARALLNLPYRHAQMAIASATPTKPGYPRLFYRCKQRHGPMRFAATYGPTGPAHEAERGSLEHFLCERYCLYSRTHGGRPYRMQIHHRPWPLQPADIAIQSHTLTAGLGFSLSNTPICVQFAQRLDVVVYPPEPV